MLPGRHQSIRGFVEFKRVEVQTVRVIGVKVNGFKMGREYPGLRLREVLRIP